MRQQNQQLTPSSQNSQHEELGVVGIRVTWTKDIATEVLMSAHVALDLRIVGVGCAGGAEDDLALTSNHLHHVDGLTRRENVLLLDQMTDEEGLKSIRSTLT